MNYIKRQALRSDLFGYVKKVNDNTVEVYLISEKKAVMDAFKKFVSKGSKRSVIENIEEEDLKYSNRSRKTGFRIIT